MSPAAGGAAPAQSAVVAGQGPDRAAARRDPPSQAEAADPANAAARKTAWGVPAPTPAAAATAMMATPGAGSIIGGDASWPALVESKRGKSASSDSLKSLSDGSGPSAQEDSIAASVSPHPVVEAKPISTGSSPTTPTLPPNAAASASSQQNGSTTQLNPVRRSGSNGGNNVGSCGNGSSGSRRAANSSAGGGSMGNVGDGINRNTESLGSGSSCNSSNGDGSSNLSDNVPGSGTSGNSNASSRNSFGNNNWNNNMRGVGSRSGDGSNRNSGGSSNNWNNNSRYSNGSGGRGGFRGRRDHERGGNFSPRNYPRASVMPYQQQQPGFHQPGPFHRPPSPSTSHFIVPQQFVPYAPPFVYHGDVQPYPLYLPPVEQFQNMHLVRLPMQPSWVPQYQPNLQEDIRMQIEFYFSTNNLCHDTYLRKQMNDQGWVPIDLILRFNRMRTFTAMVDTNYILDAIRGSEILEVQGNNVRRRNGWAEWLLP